MEREENSPYLLQVLLRMLFTRLFIPMIIVGLLAISLLGYSEWLNLLRGQKQGVISMSHIIGGRITSDGKVLEFMGEQTEASGGKEITTIFKNGLHSATYFKKIYYLDKNNKVLTTVPYDRNIKKLHISYVYNSRNVQDREKINTPTPYVLYGSFKSSVYLIRHLSNGRSIAGEINLALFNKGVAALTKRTGRGTIYVFDEGGSFLTNTKEKLNSLKNNLNVSQVQKKVGDYVQNQIYSYNGEEVIGTIGRVGNTKWIVVNQISLLEIFSYYGLATIMILSISCIIWLLVARNGRRQLKQYVTGPLDELIRVTNYLAAGDFAKVDFSSYVPASFCELDKLSQDFQIMSNNLKSRENALKESEMRIKGLVDRLPIGLIIASLDGNIIETNPILKDTLGFLGVEELSNINIINFLWQSAIGDKEKFTKKNIYALDGYEAEICCHDGKKRWIQIDSHIVYDCKGQAALFECSIQDISKRIDTEYKIREQQELLLRSEQAQREILEKDLIMKDEFISLISHEFNTPLNVIYSAIQLIRYSYFDKIPDRVIKLIENIELNTFRQLRLGNNLIDITKIKEEQYKLNFEIINIVSLCEKITRLAEPYGNKKSVKISFKADVKRKMICTDQDKVEIIILNLLSNAIKFTQKGGSIEVVLEEKSDLNCMDIFVKDTGIGIPKEKQELIFQRFGQVNKNLSSRQAEGTGIGLSLVKLLSNALKGTVEFTSDINTGSIFIFRLPYEINREGSENILTIIDDNDENRLYDKVRVQFSDIYL